MGGGCRANPWCKQREAVLSFLMSLPLQGSKQWLVAASLGFLLYTQLLSTQVTWCHIGGRDRHEDPLEQASPPVSPLIPRPRLQPEDMPLC